MQDPDEVTAPGGPLLLDGPVEARAIADLAVMLKFYASQLEQLAGELRRGPATSEQRATLYQRMRSLAGDFAQITNLLAPWNAPRPPEQR
jgi:hypothetical protein